MEVKFKKLNDNAKMPVKATDGSGAYDLYCTSVCLQSRNTGHSFSSYIEYGTGLAIEIPKGYGGFLLPRSSVSNRNIFLCNGVGFIDSDYRGEIKARFYERDHRTADPYTAGERCLQLLILPIPEIEFVEVKELSSTDRDTGGFGSTGN